MKKHKQKQKQQFLTKDKYIKTRVRELPFHECLINEDWKTSGMATITISRKQPSGKYSFGCYMVDAFCLGLKNTLYNVHFSEEQYKEFLSDLSKDLELVECDLVYAHNIIYGAIDYAEELGFSPQKDFDNSEYILDPNLIDDGIDDIEFGKDGKPLFISGPYDDVDKITATLNKTN